MLYFILLIHRLLWKKRHRVLFWQRFYGFWRESTTRRSSLTVSIFFSSVCIKGRRPSRVKFPSFIYRWMTNVNAIRIHSFVSFGFDSSISLVKLIFNLAFYPIMSIIFLAILIRVIKSIIDVSCTNKPRLLWMRPIILLIFFIFPL